LIKIAAGAILGTNEENSANESAGTISPEIASASSFGQVRLQGGSHLAAGGTLAPVLTGGYVPANSTEFAVFRLGGGSLDGAFGAVSNGFSTDYAHTGEGYVGVVYGSAPGGGGSSTTGGGSTGSGGSSTGSGGSSTTHTSTGSKSSTPSQVSIEHITVTSRGVEVTIKTSESGTVAISGAALSKTFVKLKAGTHKIKVIYSRTGRSDHRHQKTTIVQASLKSGGASYTTTRAIKL
jgi:hypothetical protein